MRIEPDRQSVTQTHVKVTALIGYARMWKADGSQVIDLQRDALAKAGVDLDHRLYADAASNERDDQPGLEACIKALRHGDTLVMWKLDRLGREPCAELGITRQTLYRFVGPKRELRNDGQRMLDRRKTK